MKLFIGCANSQEYVPAAFHWSWEAIRKPYPYEKRRFDHSDDIVRNNRIISEFLKSDCDILVKMDIDQQYPEGYFEYMVPYVEQFKVIGPLLHNKWRKSGYRPLMFQENDFPFLAESIIDASGISDVPYSHTNLFYAREVLENIKPPWYVAEYTYDGTKRSSDSDFGFLDKVKTAGYKLYINTTVEVKHLVMEGVDSELFDMVGRKRS